MSTPPIRNFVLGFMVIETSLRPHGGLAQANHQLFELVLGPRAFLGGPHVREPPTRDSIDARWAMIPGDRPWVGL
jgi:hypothetical protein